jgi:hypothetical protein
MTAPAALGTGAEPDPGPPADDSDDSDNEGARGMGPLGITVMTVAILVIAVGVSAIITHGFRTKTRVAYQVPAVFTLQPGQCFNSGHNDINLTLRPCSTPHEAEVFATFPVIGSSWPGDAALQAEAQSGCTARISGYMNPGLAATSLDQEYIYPDKVAWAGGVRTIICDVRSSDGPITGSVRQSP